MSAQRDTSPQNAQPAVGRGAQVAPANRFEATRLVDDFEQFDEAEEASGERRVPTVFFDDDSKTIIRENDSPDISFRYSINPYRGCEHG